MLRTTRCEFVHDMPCEQVSGRITELEDENHALREALSESRMANEHLRADLRCCRDVIRSRHPYPTLQLVDRIAKLEELVDLYEWGLVHDGTPIDKLIWSRKVDRLREEVGLG